MTFSAARGVVRWHPPRAVVRWHPPRAVLDLLRLPAAGLLDEPPALARAAAEVLALTIDTTGRNVDACLDAVWALVKTRGYATRSAKDDD